MSCARRGHLRTAPSDSAFPAACVCAAPPRFPARSSSILLRRLNPRLEQSSGGFSFEALFAGWPVRDEDAVLPSVAACASIDALSYKKKRVQTFSAIKSKTRTVAIARPSPEVMSLSWSAGMIELVLAPLLIVGLFTRPVAFILAGQMAFSQNRRLGPPRPSNRPADVRQRRARTGQEGRCRVVGRRR
jgi:uncharacterized membrane protein YphA (DoxX/SURF4 family)